MHSYNENGKQQLMDDYNFKIASDRVNSKNKMINLTGGKTSFSHRFKQDYN